MLNRITAAAMVLAVQTINSMGHAEPMHLDATISYSERIALPPDAVLQVELLDTSRADASSVQLSAQRFKLDFTPRTVEIAYDTDLIDERMTYTISAQILSGDRVLFRSTTATPVLTREAPSSVNLVLEMMPGPSASGEAQQSIYGTTWQVVEVRGRALVADNPPNLTLDDTGQFGLFAGCNRFSGTLQAIDGEFSMPDNFAGTMMACPEELSRLEQVMLTALSEARTYVRNGQNLALTSETGVTILRFREVSG